MAISEKQCTVTGEELVQRARDMIPMLRAKAAEVEQNRMVPRETIEAFVEAGFLKITQPAKWGGYEMDLEVFCRVLMEIGAGCPSSAWVLSVLGVHNWEMGLFGDKACEELWSNNPNVLISSSYSPFGTATKVDGGWILNGTWRSSSGIDHVDWTIIGAYEYDENGKVLDHKAFLVPKTQYRLIDDWDVYGLGGTGSKSLVVENVFVPDYRAHSMLEQPPSPDRPPLYSLHQTFVFTAGVASSIIGFAQSAIDYYIEEMRTRQSLRKRESGSTVAKESPYIKDRLGNAVLKVRSARARVLNAIREATDRVKKGDPLSPSELAILILDCAATGRDCSEAVILLHRAQAARGVWRANPIQRVLRDVMVGANHATQNSDDTAGIVGGVLLGDGLPPRFLNINGYPPGTV